MAGFDEGDHEYDVRVQRARDLAKKNGLRVQRSGGVYWLEDIRGGGQIHDWNNGARPADLDALEAYLRRWYGA